MSQVILLGTARPLGNTAQLAKAFSKQVNANLINLSNHQINHFNYQQQDDDFIPLVKKLLHYQTITLASPVYWYSISSQMKVFLDRLTELLIFNQELGRTLKGKNIQLIATGASQEPESCFEQQVKLSADYLGMHYKGMLYCHCEENFELAKHITSIENFYSRNST